MRVLVCRPHDEAEATGRRLAEAGHEPVIAPVIEVVSLPVELPPTGLDGLVLTSARAVAALAVGDVAAHRCLPVFAVGETTAAAARARGFADVRTAGGDASSLPDLVRLTLPAGASLLYPAGRVHKPTLPAALRAQGCRVDVRDSYDARPAGPWPAAVTAQIAGAQIQACLHFSQRSAALALAAAAAGGVLGPFLRLRHGALSPEAGGPLIAAGATDVVHAARPREDSLLQALWLKLP